MIKKPDNNSSQEVRKNNGERRDHAPSPKFVIPSPPKLTNPQPSEKSNKK